MGTESFHMEQRFFKVPPLILKARHLQMYVALLFAGTRLA